MLRKCVDAAPCRNNERVEEFLTPSSTPEPKLPNEQEDGQKDTISDEGATHDKVSQTLSNMIASTESQCRNSSKYHLNPSGNRHQLSSDAVGLDNNLPYPAVDPFLKVEFQIYTHDDLNYQYKH